MRSAKTKRMDVSSLMVPTRTICTVTVAHAPRMHAQPTKMHVAARKRAFLRTFFCATGGSLATIAPTTHPLGHLWPIEPVCPG